MWTQVRSTFTRLATGGDWAINQAPSVRRDLTWFWLDGFFASASDNIVVTYMSIYLLALGATQSQIGIMSSLSSLSAAILLMPGAMLVERMGHRRRLVLLCSSWARLVLLIVALLPFAIKSPWIVPIAIVFSVSRDAMSNLSYPAWMSLSGDVVPIEGRGRFFSSRNFIMSLAGMVVTLLAGLLISNTVQPVGYQISLFVAFAVGTLSIFSFSHLTDRQANGVPPREKNAPGMLDQLKEVFSHREFLYFAIATAIWNFSLNIAGPFFNVYLVQDLHADAAMVGLTSIASSLATMLVQRKMGELNDRWGPQKLTMIAGLLIPIVPMLWVFATTGWHIIPINLLSGVLWGAYNLASFNYLLKITPAAQRARYSAVFQITVTISLAIGAALGSVLVSLMGFLAVFTISAVGRLIAAALFAVLVTRRLPPAKENLDDQPAG